QVRAEEVESEGEQDAEQHDQLQAEMDEPGTDGRQGEYLAREIDLLDESTVARDGNGGRAEGCPEQVPRHEAGEEVEGEVGDAGLQELPEDDPVDHQQEQRSGERPQEAEGRVLVLDLELFAHQVHEQLAETPDIGDRGPKAE